MKKAFTIFVGFMHDFAAGCWAAAVLAVFWLHRQPIPPELAGGIVELKKRFFYLGIACVIVVFASGGGRTFTYMSNVYGEDAEKLRRRMLIMKHIVLFAVFGLGTYWQYTMVFK